MDGIGDNRRFRIPASRRLSCDLLYFNRNVPLCGHDRVTDLAAVAEARQRSAIRVSWPALFLKAYAIVARDVPQLRQTWHRFPLPHLYQHGQSVAVVTVQRELDGEPWLFWGRIGQPDQLPLEIIQQRIDSYCNEPCRQVHRKQLQLAGLPLVFRRLIWWWNLNIATRNRAKRLGTFFLSTLASRGVAIQIPPSIHTGCLTYGPLDQNGRCTVTLAYDHRIMDGVVVADALRQLETTLNETLATELRQLAHPQKRVA
jgi:hypothetical protein